MQQKRKINSAFFITFNGNCKKALALYQSCFGGELHFDTFDGPLEGIDEMPVVSGCLVSEKMAVYGSDLVYEQGRKTGNFMAAYLHCESVKQRNDYLEKLAPKERLVQDPGQKLIEITDPFDVHWIFGI